MICVAAFFCCAEAVSARAICEEVFARVICVAAVISVFAGEVSV